MTLYQADVAADLHAWAPRVRPGGIVAGHGEPATVFHEEDVELPRDESEKEEAVSAA